MARKIWPFMSKRKPKVQQPTRADLERRVRELEAAVRDGLSQGWNTDSWIVRLEDLRRDLEAAS